MIQNVLVIPVHTHILLLVELDLLYFGTNVNVDHGPYVSLIL